MKAKELLLQPFLALDQLANWLLLGDPRETISSRLGRQSRKGAILLTCKILNVIFFTKDHCAEAREKIDNLKSNDHPLIFFLIFSVLFFGIVLGIRHLLIKIH